MNCTICDWPADDILARSDLAKAFLARSPARPGHIVVAAEAHKPTITDLAGDEAAAVLRLARDVALATAPLLAIEKFYLAAVGDVDPHFHLHLLPKTGDDPGLGRFIFSSDGWQGHAGGTRDPELERRIKLALGKTAQGCMPPDPA